MTEQEYIEDTLTEAKKTLSQKLAEEAKKRVRELTDKVTDPETYIDAVTGKVKKIASHVREKSKMGNSLKPKKR